MTATTEFAEFARQVAAILGDNWTSTPGPEPILYPTADLSRGDGHLITLTGNAPDSVTATAYSPTPRLRGTLVHRRSVRVVAMSGTVTPDMVAQRITDEVLPSLDR